MVALTWSFWSVDGAAYKRIYNETEIERESGLTSAILTMPTARVSWVCAFFLLFYVGVEVALGGWIVVFMTRVRGGEAFASGMTATGFWLGITLGRVVLGFVTPRIGVKIATTVKSPRRHHPGIDLTDLFPLGIHCLDNRPRAPILARPAILRLRRRRCAAGLLPWPAVPQRRARREQDPPAPSTRRGDWVRGRAGRLRRCNLAVCGGCAGADVGRAGPATDYPGDAVRHDWALAVLAAVEEETGLEMAMMEHVLGSIDGLNVVTDYRPRIKRHRLRYSRNNW